MVDEAATLSCVSESAVPVAFTKEKLPARFKVPPRKVLPLTLRLFVIVVEPVTAREVEVAPAAVSPPLKASCVVVALFGKR